MVGYGASFHNAQRNEWIDAYLDYDKLKTYLGEIKTIIARRGSVLQQQQQATEEESALIKSSSTGDDRYYDTIETADGDYEDSDDEARLSKLIYLFHVELRKEIEKVSLFVLAKQGEIANALGSILFDNNKDQGEPSANLLFEKQSQLLLLAAAGGDDDKADAMAYSCTYLGVELLHLLKFISMNAMAIRKILKKHDKIISPLQDEMSSSRPLERQYQLEDNEIEDKIIIMNQSHSKRSRYYDYIHDLLSNTSSYNGPAGHMQHLANSDSITAINASLLTALIQIEDSSANKILSTDDFVAIENKSLVLLRFQYVINSIQYLRDNADIMYRPFRTFLSRKAMIGTGSTAIDFDRSTTYALDVLINFDPNNCLSMSNDELIEWKRNLFEETIDDFGDRTPPSKKNEALSFQEIKQITSTKDNEMFWGGVNASTMIINLMSTLLYTVNYYIVAPTANHYAVAVGTDGAFGATLIGASSFSALFAAFLYSLWYTKSSFKSALLFSSMCPLIGNLLYAVAISYHSLQLAMLGRILVGFGSAEVVNRQLISTCVSFKSMTQASAYFVAASALGMSIGPLIAGILDISSGRDYNVDLHLPFMPAGGIIYNHITSPGFVMAIMWFIEVIALSIAFYEPTRINGSNSDAVSATSCDDDESDKSIKQSSKSIEITKYGTGSVMTSSDIENGHDDITKWDSKSGRCGLFQLVTSEITKTWTLIFGSPALPITLLLFGYIELADEVLISSCSMVCRRYFGWHGSTAGFLIASLGALVLPAHFVVERATHFNSDRRIIKYSIWFIIGGLILIMNYEGLLYDIFGFEQVVASDDLTVMNMTKHVEGIEEISINGDKVKHILNKHAEFPYDWSIGNVVYLTFLSLVFMGTIILEGVDTSLMAKVTPPALNERFINSGLLATLVGTLGRVIGDSTITISALLDINVFIDFVNATFIPVLLLAIGGMYLVKKHYKKLV